MKINGKVYGKTKSGKRIDSVSIINKNNLAIEVMSYGATLISVKFPDRDGKIDEITLGKADFSSYESGHPFMGSTVGRYANRINRASFILDGKKYNLPANNGKNSLHGGSAGFDKKVWDIFPFKSKDKAGVKFIYVSEDGESGYPGKLEISSTYVITEKNELFFTYEATCNKSTPINITNHTYWNLRGAGKSNILDHNLRLNSDYFLPVNSEQIPTGELKDVTNTEFDFRSMKKIGKDIKNTKDGYDHCFTTACYEKDKPAIFSNIKEDDLKNLKETAVVTEDETGRKIELYTTLPGIQFYSTNKLFNLQGREAIYNRNDGFCLETQNFPDAPNRENFPDSVLKPGEKYFQSTMIRFSNF